MYVIKYDIDYSDLTDFVEVVRERLNQPSHLIEAIQTAGKYAVQEWIKTANAKFKHSEGGYVQGILEGIQYPFDNNPLDLLIENKVPYAKYLEEGFGSFDMKKALTTSSKVRVSKRTGARYLVIPFRHGTPGSVTFRSVMPQSTYQQASRLRPSYMAGTYQEGVVQRKTPLENPIPPEKKQKYIQEAEVLRRSNPQKVTRYSYRWGGRLRNVGGQYEGMVRFEKNVNIVREEFKKDTALGKFTYSRIIHETTNNVPYSHYITFRVMSELSSGWIHPGIKGRYILKETVERIEQPIREMLKDAIKEDLKGLKFD